MVIPYGTCIIYEKYLKYFLLLGWLGLLLFIYFNPVKLRLFDSFERLDTVFTDFNPVIREFIHKISIPCLATVCLVSSSIRSRNIQLQQLHTYNVNVSAINRRFLLLSILSILGMLIFDLISLKRIQTITALTIIFISYILISKSFKFNLKRISIAVASLIIFLYSLSFVTTSRDISVKGSTYASWLLYYIGPLSYFDRYVGNSYIDGYYFGRSTLMGIQGFMFGPIVPIRVVGFFVPRIPEFYFDRQINLTIGNNLDFNAFGTLMLDGFYDFGESGVLLLAFAVGLLSTALFFRAQVTSSPTTICLAAVAMSWVILSPIGWAGGLQFAMGQLPISIFVLMILYRIRAYKSH